MGKAFGEFELDWPQRQLLRGSSAVHLTPKALELLHLLLEQRPNAVSKADIHERLWPNTNVSDVNLSRLVFEIRAAVDDDRHTPSFIRTVWGFGYALREDSLQEPMATSNQTARFHARLIASDSQIPLRNGENILGRTDEALAWLDHGSVSRRHARIQLRDGEALLEDLGSRHGTFVDGTRVGARTWLRDGMRIRLGSLEFTFRIFDARATDAADDSSHRATHSS